MPGTKEGAKKAIITKKKKYTPEQRSEIARKAGSTPTLKKKGFAANRQKAVEAGKKGKRIVNRHGKDGLKYAIKI